MTQVYVTGAFDDLQSRDIRFLQEAAKRGRLTVALWADERVTSTRGTCKFPLAERRYFLEGIRFVDEVVVMPASMDTDELPLAGKPDRAERAIWAVLPADAMEAKRAFCRRHGLQLEIIRPEDLAGFPLPQFDAAPAAPHRKRVVVTGSFDWFHSGHVRFFEECAQLGELYAVVGHDDNIHLLKGEGHPLLRQDERLYVVASCRYVTRAMVSSGSGWMDAEPEIAQIRPHIYAVNEDGDKPEKRAFCAQHDIEYVVLKRTPKEGLPPRSSSQLRGF